MILWQPPKSESEPVVISVDKWEELVRLIAKLGASLSDATQESRDRYNKVMSFIVDIEK